MFLRHQPVTGLFMGFARSCRMRSLLAITLLGAATALSAQIDTSSFAPHRYLVLYRNGTIPGDAETRIEAAGASLTRRNEHLGMAAVNAPSTENDTETLRRLSSQPNVAYVLHDRILFAHKVLLKAAQASIPNGDPPAPSNPGTGVGKLPIHSPIHPGVPVLPVPPASVYDSFYTTPQSWAVQQVGGYGAGTPGGPTQGPWNTTLGKGVRIAILDSGIDVHHPDLSPNVVMNLSEIDQTAYPSACDDGTPQDQSGHGTWTASLAAAAMGPGTGELIGVAPAASLLNIKVLERTPGNGSILADQCEAGEASGLLSWVMQGIEDAITNRADVISLSLGATADLTTGDGAGLLAAFNQVTYAATQANIVVIASAGNDGLDLTNPRYVELPAQSRGVLAITASTNTSCAQNLVLGAVCAPGPTSLAYYSDYGAPLNGLSAPGGSYPEGADTTVSGWVRGACSSGLPGTADGLPSDPSHSFGCFNLGHTDYVQAIGTSASAPLAAGVAALIRAAHPDWSAATVVEAMRSTAIPTVYLPFPQINAAAALAYQPGATGGALAVAANPSSVPSRYEPASRSHPLF